MQILLEVPDAQAASFMEVLSSFRDVVVKPVPNEIPKTAESHCTADDFDVPMEGYWDGREEERPPFVIGCLKGQIWMADDFDVPMEGYWDGREEERPTPVFGCCKGKGWIADDFDTPLEEFKEYME